MRRGRSELHTLAGPYALDAVSGEDRARFERHLAHCESCGQEIRGLREATARIGVSAAVRPRPELKGQALRAAARTRQLPPVSRDAPAASPGWRGFLAGARGMAGRRAGLWPPRLAAALAAGLLVIAVTMGVLMVGAQHRLDTDQVRGRAIAAVLNASDVTMLTAKVTTGGTATILESRHEHSLVFTAARLRALPAGSSYELWLMGPEGTRSAGMLPASREGMIGPMVVSGLAAGDDVGLTVEPAGGAARPTSAMIMKLGLVP
ncbi:MAG: anti-sigma factor [Streptosporangiaceae bacterium]|jgi:anti-sigma-K factor RskA